MKLGSSASLLAAGLVAVGISVAPATAQNYPTRAIELVVPFNPGGSADGSARPLAESVGKVLGKPMVVENRAGAQSVIGASYVAKANTDGHTLLYTAGGTILTPFLVANMTFDPLKDLTPVAMVATFPYVVIGGPNLPFSDFKGMMTYAKANPGKLSFAASDPVTTANINLLLTALKLDMTVVNYTGGGAVMADLLGGHVSLSMVGAGAYLPHKQAGKIKAIVATSADRIDTLKDIPTLKELGYSDLVIDSFYAVTGPKGMDPSAVKALQNALGKALSSPDYPLRRQLVNLGFDVADDLSSEAALKKFTAYSNQMSGVFTKLGIKPQ